MAGHQQPDGAQRVTQLSLPLARKRDPQTSHRAAGRVPAFLPTHETRITSALEDAGAFGATYRDIAQQLGMEPAAIARRLRGLERKGLVRRYQVNGEYIERGGMCVWWKA